MDWATKRKFIYAFASVMLVLIVGVYELRGVFFPSPTCFDSKKNGYESGLDCGGTCSLRCTNDIAQIKPDWATAVRTGNNTYDFVSMLSNNNINSAPKALGYVFVALNKSGDIIRKEVGTTTALIDGSFPVIIENVNLPEQPANLLLRLSPAPYYATAERPTVPLVKVSNNYRYEPGSISRIYATIINTSRNVYLKLPVRLVAYDEHDNVVAVGESIVPMLDKEETKEVVFTWHYLLPIIPTKFRAYPIISPYWLSQ